MSQNNPLDLFVMSLWKWLLAAWIYEEVLDDNSNNPSHDNTRDYDSSDDREDRDDYDVFKDLF